MPKQILNKNSSGKKSEHKTPVNEKGRDIGSRSDISDARELSNK